MTPMDDLLKLFNTAGVSMSVKDSGQVFCMFIDIPNTTNPNECGNIDNGLLCRTVSIAFFIYPLPLSSSI